MKCDSRLSSVLHMLLHLADHDQPQTSEALARYLDTNPVVVRRVLGGLRERGLVESARGPGGGWTLARPLAAITLHDVHIAVGAPLPFALGHRRDHPDCLVERVVNEAVDEGLREAERLLLAHFATISLATLQQRIRRRRPRAGIGRSNVHVS